MNPNALAPERYLGSVGVGQEWLPDEDLLATYDSVMLDVLSIPLNTGGRVYSPQELELLPLDTLREILDSRGRDSKSPHRGQLIQNVLNTQRVPIVFATPANAWAFPEYMTGNVEQAPDFAATRNVHYPVAALQRFAPQQDQRRFSRPLRRKLAWSGDGNAVMQGLQPVPVTIQYQLDLLTLTMRDTNAALLHYSRTFLDKVPVPVKVNHGEPWGYLPIFIVLDSVRETSQLEGASDRAEKILRTVYTFTIQGQIPSSTKATRTVREVNYQFADETVPDNVKSLEEVSYPGGR